MWHDRRRGYLLESIGRLHVDGILRRNTDVTKNINQQTIHITMAALNYLNEVINNRSAFVPAHLANAIVAAGRALGFVICGGLYDPDTKMRVLYVA